MAITCGLVFLGLALGLFLLPALALAQDASVGSIIDQACADHGELLKWIAGIAGTSTIASLLANFRSRLPGIVVRLLDVVALNLIAALKTAAKEAPKAAPLLILGFGLALGGCQITGDIAADTAANTAAMQAFAPKVQAANAEAIAKIHAFNEGVVTDAVAVGQAACADAALLDTAVAMAQPAMAATVDPKVLAAQAGVRTSVKSACAIIAQADPSTPAASVATAVASVVAALPQLKATLAAGPAAAAAEAPAASTPVPAPAVTPASPVPATAAPSPAE